MFCEAWGLNDMDIIELLYGSTRVLIGQIEQVSDCRRQCESTAVRQILGQCAVGHKPSGAPYLIDNPLVNISISHCRHLVAVALDQERKVGIDIEEPREQQLERVISHILSDDERHIFDVNTPLRLRAWTLKEAAFKAADLPDIDYRRDIRISSFNSGIVSVRNQDYKIAECAEKLLFGIAATLSLVTQ